MLLCKCVSEIDGEGVCGSGQTGLALNSFHGDIQITRTHGIFQRIKGTSFWPKDLFFKVAISLKLDRSEQFQIKDLL